MESSEYIEVSRSYKDSEYSILKTFYIDEYDAESIMTQLLSEGGKMSRRGIEEFVEERASKIVIEKTKIQEETS